MHTLHIRFLFMKLRPASGMVNFDSYVRLSVHWQLFQSKINDACLLTDFGVHGKSIIQWSHGWPYDTECQEKLISQKVASFRQWNNTCHLIWWNETRGATAPYSIMHSFWMVTMKSTLLQVVGQPTDNVLLYSGMTKPCNWILHSMCIHISSLQISECRCLI